MIFLSLALAAIVAGLAYRVRALTRGGAGAAWIIGALVLGLGGWRWAAALLAFFLTSTMLSRWRRRRKAELGFEKVGRRDARQVFANGGIAAFCSLLPLLHWAAPIQAYLIYLAALAAANADTWATEIGAGLGGRAYDLWTRKPVPAGTSGAVSVGGLAAAVAGAALLGLFALTLAAGLAVTACGLLGSLGDSLLGATLQAQWRDPQRPGHWTERPQACPPERGQRWMDNDGVNLLCTLLAALLAASLIFFPVSPLYSRSNSTDNRSKRVCRTRGCPCKSQIDMSHAEQSGREPRQAILESVYASITDPLLVMDSELVIVEANDHLLNRLGKTRPDVIGKPWNGVFPHLEETGRGADLQTVLAQGRPHQGRIPLAACVGEAPLLFDVMTYPVFDAERGQVTHLVEYARDVTAEVRLQLQVMEANHELLLIQEQMETKTAEIDAANHLLEEKVTTLEVINEWLGRIAVLDVMTDLPNHRGFQEQLAYEVHQWQRSRRPFCLILLDVDDFKSYNDRHGHPQGDVLLARLANLMRGAIRMTDLPARYGGEEFAILLPDTAKPGAALVADRLRAAVADAEFEHGSVTISIGVAEYPADAGDAPELIGCADLAMYGAKSSGKNAVCLWQPNMAQSVAAETRISALLPASAMPQADTLAIAA